MAQRRLCSDLTDLSLSYTVHYRASCQQQCLYFLPEPQGKDRFVGFFALLGGMPYLLRRSPLPSFGAVAQSNGKSLSPLQQYRGSIFLGVRHRYYPYKGAFPDQDRVRALKSEWGSMDLHGVVSPD